MIFSKRMMFLNILLLVLSAAVLWVSCDLFNGNDDDGDDDGIEYPEGTLNVDYNVANNAVFFDFSTGTKTVLSHDFFDLAIDSSGNIIANSGSYGSGVWVYTTGESDITMDFSGEESKVQEYTFKAETPLLGHQTVVNPLGELGMAASNVCLIKVQHKTNDDSAYFKVIFSMNMPGMGGYAGPPQFVVTVVPGLGAGETGKVEIKAGTGGVTAGYGWLYFKLVGEAGPRVLNNGTEWLGGGTPAPQAPDWDILAIRTNELQESADNPGTIEPDMPVAGRSSVLLNTYKSVKAKKIEGKLIDQITDADQSEDGLSDEIDAIGYSWYGMAGMPPTFSVAENTYVIKTVEGKIALFQPESFYGPNRESFVMDFSYSYPEDDAE
jgi:hypothetical protein